MKTVQVLIVACIGSFLLFSCNGNFKDRIKGNGKKGHLEKALTISDKILISGNYDVEIIQGNTK